MKILYLDSVESFEDCILDTYTLGYWFLENYNVQLGKSNKLELIDNYIIFSYTYSGYNEEASIAFNLMFG